MNKFQTILNGVIEELATNISLNPQQIEKDLERLPQQTKDVIQKITKPMEAGTETNPNEDFEDLINSLGESEFKKLRPDVQEKIKEKIDILTKTGILKPNTENTEENQKNILTQQSNSNPASYGV